MPRFVPIKTAVRLRFRFFTFYFTAPLFCAFLFYVVPTQGQTRITFSAFSGDLGSLAIPAPPRIDTKSQAPCPANAGMPMPQSSLENISSLSKVDDKFVVEVSALIDKCLPVQADTSLAQRTLIAEMAKHLQSATRPKKDNGREASIDDLVNVALLARTLVGEIATKSKCQGEGANSYTKAVGRVILNRASFASKRVTRGLVNWFDFVDRDSFEGADPIRAVLFKKQQFSVWNPGDNAQRWAMCPARVPGQKYYDNKGKIIASASIGKFIDWQSAVLVATEMVFARSSFLLETNSVNSLYYTEGAAMHASRVQGRYTQVVGATVAGTPIHDVDCLELWNPPTSR